MPADIDTKKVSFVAVITVAVVLSWLVPLTVAAVVGRMEIDEFSRAVGPTAGLLIGYWIRGEQ